VRDQIVEALRRARASDQAKRTAEQAADQLRQGADWAAAMPGVAVESPGPVGREASDVPRGVREAVFALSAPQPHEASIGIAELDDGSAAVIRLTRVSDGAVTPDAPLAEVPEAAMLAQLMGRTVYDAMLTDIELRAKVERRPVAAAATDL
jgi:peptidyl-prolyl cis-trans isomerase D